MKPWVWFILAELLGLAVGLVWWRGRRRVH